MQLLCCINMLFCSVIFFLVIRKSTFCCRGQKHPSLFLKTGILFGQLVLKEFFLLAMDLNIKFRQESTIYWAMLLLGALTSFGGIWLHRNQSTRPLEANQPQESTNTKREVPKEWKNRGRITPTGDIPPSITDINPKDAYQMPLSDSDTE